MKTMKSLASMRNHANAQPVESRAGSKQLQAAGARARLKHRQPSGNPEQFGFPEIDSFMKNNDVKV